jgi:hypothetical protein
VTGPVTAADLKKAEGAVRSAGHRVTQAQDRRDALVRRALAEGWTHARIADATGLTRGRIGQIATQTTDTPDGSTPA